MKNFSSNYIIRLYDEELLKFSMSSAGLKGLTAHILSVNSEKKKLLPHGLDLSDEGIIEWLKRRIIPKNRAFVHEILRTMGLNVNDVKGIIDVCKGLSLNDIYWLVPENFTGNFTVYNLCENRFSEVLSFVAYNGAGRIDEKFTTSPEFTTHEMLRKA